MKLEVYTGKVTQESESNRGMFDDVEAIGLFADAVVDDEEGAVLGPGYSPGLRGNPLASGVDTLVRLSHCGRHYVFDLSLWDWTRIALGRSVASGMMCLTCRQELVLDIPARQGHRYLAGRLRLRIALAIAWLHAAARVIFGHALLVALGGALVGALGGLGTYPERAPFSLIVGGVAGAVLALLFLLLMWLRRRAVARREAALEALSRPEWNGSGQLGVWSQAVRRPPTAPPPRKR